MDSKSNSLSLDFRDNPELKTLLGGLQPGDRVTLELELMTKSVDDERFEATVDSIAAETEEPEEGGDAKSATVEPNADEPVMIVMAAKAKKSKPAAAVEEEVE